MAAAAPKLHRESPDTVAELRTVDTGLMFRGVELSMESTVGKFERAIEMADGQTVMALETLQYDLSSAAELARMCAAVMRLNQS